jgi:hypothetical protein
MRIVFIRRYEIDNFEKLTSSPSSSDSSDESEVSTVVSEAMEAIEGNEENRLANLNVNDFFPVGEESCFSIEASRRDAIFFTNGNDLFLLLQGCWRFNERDEVIKSFNLLKNLGKVRGEFYSP